MIDHPQGGMGNGHFHWGKAALAFLVYYLGVGAVWYVVEVKVSPLLASAVTLLLTPPVLWLASRLCLRSLRITSALILGAVWCISAVLLDVILWVEPLGVLSGPLIINFSAKEFYMERYFPYLLLTYPAILMTPIVYVGVRHRANSSQSEVRRRP